MRCPIYTFYYERACIWYLPKDIYHNQSLCHLHYSQAGVAHFFGPSFMLSSLLYVHYTLAAKVSDHGRATIN